MNTPPPRRSQGLPSWLGPLLLALVMVFLYLRLVGPGGGDMPVAGGKGLAALQSAEGWLNLPPGVSGDELLAQLDEGLVLVDCWATWCGPCRQALPELADLREKYQPQGVRLVGVTQESGDDLPKIEQLMADTPGFEWPVAYGGEEFMAEMNIQAIPTVILFQSGRVVWSGIGMGGVTEALDKVLASQ